MLHHIFGGYLPLSDRAPLRVAIVGFGDHVVKTINPCFERSNDIDVVRIYVRSPEKYVTAHPAQAGLFTGTFDEVLLDGSVDVVYVGTPIATHFDYANAALHAGKHVWCEKSLTDNVGKTRELVATAKARMLFLGEVSMYQYHRQFHWIEQQIIERQAAGERLLGVRARFSIPELAATNIRYSRVLGGGALLDVGYYPLSIATALFGLPQEVLANGFTSEDLQVDLSGMALLSYVGFGCQCMWAIGSSYINEVELSFSKTTLLISRAFSKPAGLVTKAQVIGNFGQLEDPIEIPGDDQFANMFQAFVSAIRAGNTTIYAKFSEKCVINAMLLNCVQVQIERSVSNW